MAESYNLGAEVARAAEEWIGTPVRWQGRIKQVGCDCKGLVAGIAEELGLDEAQSFEALTGDYGKVVDPLRLRAGLRRLFDPVPVSELAAGDVLLIKLGGKAQHLAIHAPRAGVTGVRVIEALGRVERPRVSLYRRQLHEIDSAWRWKVRPLVAARCSAPPSAPQPWEVGGSPRNG